LARTFLARARLRLLEDPVTSPADRVMRRLSEFLSEARGGATILFSTLRRIADRRIDVIRRLRRASSPVQLKLS
jgi:hypothetical protein